MSKHTLTTQPWRQSARAHSTAQERLTPADLRSAMLEHKLEEEVQAEIVSYLERAGLPHTITNAEATYNLHGQRVQRVAEGWPDVTACENGALCPMHAGKLMGIEVKRAVGGTLSYKQAATLKQLYQAGALICVARSEEDVIEVRRTGVRAGDLAEIEQALARGPKLTKASAPRVVQPRCKRR
jgi:hypothetical protein